MIPYGLPLCRSERVGRFSNLRWYRTERFACRDDHHRQNQQRQRQAGGEKALPQMKFVDEQTERHQAVDDRGHAGQVRDIDLDQLGHPILRRVLFQIDGRGHARADGHEAVSSMTSTVPTHARRECRPGRDREG